MPDQESHRLTRWQRASVRQLRKKAGRADGEPLQPEDWKHAWYLHEHGLGGGVGSLLRRLPSSPRCGVCGAPFAGGGGRLDGPLGYRPSQKNPDDMRGLCGDGPAGGDEDARRGAVCRPARLHRPGRGRRPARGGLSPAALLPLRGGRPVSRRNDRQADGRRGHGALPPRYDQADDVDGGHRRDARARPRPAALRRLRLDGGAVRRAGDRDRPGRGFRREHRGARPL